MSNEKKQPKQLTEVEAIAKIAKILTQLPTQEQREKVLRFLSE